MKKIMGLVVLGLFLLSAGGAMAGFGIPSTGSSAGDKAVSVGKQAVNKGVEAAINDKIAKKNCAFKDAKTKTETTCNLAAIIADLKGWRQGLESTIANNVQVHIEASANKSDLAWDRVSYVQDTLRAGLSSWRWSTHKTTASGDKLKIWVNVN